MGITAIFSNSPFDNEIRFACDRINMYTKKDGEICILPGFNNAIFETENCVITAISNENILKIKIIGSAVLKFSNNLLYCFGEFRKITDTLVN